MGVGQVQAGRRADRGDGLVLFQGDHRHALAVPGGLFGDLGRAHQQQPAGAGADGQLLLLRQEEQSRQRLLVAVGPQQLAAVLLGGVGGQGHLGAFAAGKEEQHPAAVVGGQDHGDGRFPFLHTQAGGQVDAHLAHLAVLELGQAGLVDLVPVGEEEGLQVVAGLGLDQDLVPFLQLVGAGGAQALGGDLFQVALPGEEHRHRIIGHRILFGGVLPGGQVVEDLAAAGLAVLFGRRRQLLDDDPADAGGLGQDVVQVVDLLFQLLDLAGALEDILPVQVAQPDLGHILGLGLVDAEADHQVGHHLVLFLGLPDDPDGLVDVQQDGRQALQQMQPLFLAVQVVVGAAADAFGPEGRPLLQDLPHPHHPGLARDQDVEVAAEAVLQGRQPEQLGHQAVVVHAALEVQRQLEAVQVGLVPHVAQLFQLAGLGQLGDLVHDGLHRGGGRDLGDLDHVFARDRPPPGPHLDAAPAGLEDVPHLGRVVQDLPPAHKVGGGHGGADVVVRVLEQGHGGGAQLGQVERADVAGHAHRDAQRVVGQDGGEGDRQQGGLGGGAVVVGHKVHRLLVDVPEQLLADRLQPGLGVAGGGAGHIPAVRLAKVALAVHIGHQQALVAPAHPDHGVVDGGVAVGVQVHGGAHDVGGLGPRPLQQAHAVHGVQQLAVGRLEAVDLGQGPADDDAHGVGHIVGLQGAGDGVLQDAARVQDLDPLPQLGAHRFGCFSGLFFWHSVYLDLLVASHRMSRRGGLTTGPVRPDIRRRGRRCGPCARPGCPPAGCQRRGPSRPRRWASP